VSSVTLKPEPQLPRRDGDAEGVYAATALRAGEAAAAVMSAEDAAKVRHLRDKCGPVPRLTEIPWRRLSRTLRCGHRTGQER
jgi:hypothetical protein